MPLQKEPLDFRSRIPNGMQVPTPTRPRVTRTAPAPPPVMKPAPVVPPPRPTPAQQPRPRHAPRAMPGKTATGAQPNGENMGFLAKLGDLGGAVPRFLSGLLEGESAGEAAKAAAITGLKTAAAVAGATGATGAAGGGKMVPRSALAAPLGQNGQLPPVGGIPPGFGLPTGQIPQNGFDPFGDLIDFPRFQQMFGAQQPSPPQNGNGLAGTLNQLGIPNAIVLPAQQKVIASAPPGYVVVTMPDGSKKAVLKDIARKLGLWKSRAKPPISAGDWKALKKADRVKNKVKRIAKTADFVCRPSKR